MIELLPEGEHTLVKEFELPKDFVLRLGWCSSCKKLPAKRVHNHAVYCLGCWAKRRRS